MCEGCQTLLCSGLVGGGQIFPRVLLITVESSGLLLSDGRVSGGVDSGQGREIGQRLRSGLVGGLQISPRVLFITVEASARSGSSDQ